MSTLSLPFAYRSCRARLNLHNDRRRKRIPEQLTPRQDLLNPQPRSRRTRTRRKRVPYGEAAGSEEFDTPDSEGTEHDQVAVLLLSSCLCNYTHTPTCSPSSQVNIQDHPLVKLHIGIFRHFLAMFLQEHPRRHSNASLTALSEEGMASAEVQGSEEHRGTGWQPPLSVLQSYPVRLRTFSVCMALIYVALRSIAIVCNHLRHFVPQLWD